MAVQAIGLLGLLHKNLDQTGSALLDRKWRLLTRTIAGIVIALIPLSDEHALSSAALLAIVAGVLAFVVISETIGKLGAVADKRKIEAVLGQGEPGGALASLRRQLDRDFAEPAEHPNRAAALRRTMRHLTRGRPQRSRARRGRCGR